MLTEERRILQRAARDSITCELTGRDLPRYETTPAILLEPRGAFVSLHYDGKLRGCIGYIEPVKPLIRAVQEVAVKAALEDPRFPPLRLAELERVEIEISVLSRLKKVMNMDSIEVGRHGLVVELGSRRGLLLPQVAMEYGWDCLTFLENAAMKAGLPSDAWKHPDAKIFRFSAEVFGEDLRASEEVTRQ